jgi:V8-like Glu-specific endopeptidase
MLTPSSLDSTVTRQALGGTQCSCLGVIRHEPSQTALQSMEQSDDGRVFVIVTPRKIGNDVNVWLAIQFRLNSDVGDRISIRGFKDPRLTLPR